MQQWWGGWTPGQIDNFIQIFADLFMGFPGGTVVKNPPTNAGAADVGSIPGNPLQSFCLEIPWTEKPDRLQSVGSQRVGHD